jgi:hypothetical protein
MVAPFRVIFKVCFQKIWKKEELKYEKHHEQFDENNKPYLFSPAWKI